MRLKNLLLSSTLVIAALAAVPASAAQTINFETTAAGSPIVYGGSVGTDFSAIGATFTNAFYRQCGGGCPSPVNGTFVSSDNFRNPFSINFAGITNAFSFSNVSNSGGTASAFGTGGNLLESIDFSDFPGTFSFTSTGISSVSFSSNAQVGVDNFAFDDVQSVSSAVPEPTTWAMMLFGFGFIGGAMRTSKRRRTFTVSYT